MPDVERREAFERRVAEEFTNAGRQFVNELLVFMGDPPNLENVPDEFWKRYGRNLQQRLAPIVMEIYQNGAQKVLEDTGIGLSWKLPNEEAMRWAEQYTFDLVRQINRTTQERLQAYISNYFEMQKTIGALRAEIRPNITDLRLRSGRLLTSEKRAQLIATTEVTRASVQGELALAKELKGSGYEMTAVWQTNADALVCPLCGPRNGKKRGDGWRIPPPAHPGCRCWLNHRITDTLRR